jgi:5'(3')-deoxyribonucleotidase
MRLFEIAKKPTLYLDMDGVMCDFFGEWARSQGVGHYKQIPKNEIAASLDRIGQDAEEFFATLPMLPGAEQLLRAAHAYGGYTILSSPLERNEEPSRAGKRRWINTHLGSYPPDDVIFERNKARYANKNGTRNILIDDYGVNVVAWQDAGGLAFKHRYKDTAATIEWLKGQQDEITQNASAPVTGTPRPL